MERAVSDLDDLDALAEALDELAAGVAVRRRAAPWHLRTSTLAS